jgi:hypothetical protein
MEALSRIEIALWATEPVSKVVVLCWARRAGSITGRLMCPSRSTVHGCAFRYKSRVTPAHLKINPSAVGFRILVSDSCLWLDPFDP